MIAADRLLANEPDAPARAAASFDGEIAIRCSVCRGNAAEPGRSRRRRPWHNECDYVSKIISFAVSSKGQFMPAHRSFFSWLCEDQLRKLTQPDLGPPDYVSRFPPHTILCPVSLRNDNTAVCIAFQLAQQHAAELVLLHCVDAEIDSKTAKRNDERLRDLQASLSEVETKTITTWGDPASAIIRATAETDLLVMRPSQSSWLVGRLLESLSQRVCRLAHCPVLLLHEKVGKRIAPARFPTRSDSPDVIFQGAYRGPSLGRSEAAAAR